MSRNLFKIIKELEKRVEKLETKNKLLENEVDHLDTLIRLQNKCDRFNPTIPQSPWYKEPMLEPPYKITCELDKDPFVKLCKETFGL